MSAVSCILLMACLSLAACDQEHASHFSVPEKLIVKFEQTQQRRRVDVEVTNHTKEPRSVRVAGVSCKCVQPVVKTVVVPAGSSAFLPVDIDSLDEGRTIQGMQVSPEGSMQAMTVLFELQVGGKIQAHPNEVSLLLDDEDMRIERALELSIRRDGEELLQPTVTTEIPGVTFDVVHRTTDHFKATTVDVAHAIDRFLVHLSVEPTLRGVHVDHAMVSVGRSSGLLTRKIPLSISRL